MGDGGLGCGWSVCFREILLILKLLFNVLYPGMVSMNLLYLCSFFRGGFPGAKPCSSVVRHSECGLSLAWPEESYWILSPATAG
jgi:hypothetical protein